MHREHTVNLHDPSCGFGNDLRSRNPGFDQHDPPPDGGADPAGVLPRCSRRVAGDTWRVPDSAQWDTLVNEVTSRHPDLRLSQMFGMPCLKRQNGKVVAGFWKDGGITVKLTDETQRQAALALPGAAPFDPGMGRAMREWVHVSADQSAHWLALVEQAVG